MNWGSFVSCVRVSMHISEYLKIKQYYNNILNYICQVIQKFICIAVKGADLPAIVFFLV